MTRALLVLLLVPACMRGCPANGSAESCLEASDCSAGTCRHGYCVGADYARADDDCRHGPACVERGACTALVKRSFFGLDHTLECAATSEYDCQASRRCATHGACSRAGAGEVGCVAANAQLCKVTERCATHEECELDGTECVRRWASCPALGQPGTPPWAGPVALVFDFDTLRTPWQPGDAEDATIACRVEGHRRTRSTLRIAGRCAPGPGLDKHGTATFLRSGVALHRGDRIAIAVQDAEVGRAGASSFAELRYDGGSPVRGGPAGESGASGESIECVVVPRDVGRERAKRELAAVDAGLASAATERPDLERPHALAYSIESARVHAGRAALWLGWTDPALATRVAKLAAAERAWQQQLDVAIAKLAATARADPVRTKRLVVKPGTRVCGDDLRVRYGARAADRALAADSCALALAIDNTGDAEVWLALETADLGFEISGLTWLRPARDGHPAEILAAAIIEVRLDGVGAPATAGSVRLAAGARAMVLVGGAREDLALAGADRGALLVGRAGVGSAFVLRP